MDEALAERPGLMERVAGWFSRPTEEEVSARADSNEGSRTAYRYTATIRRQITSFEDAYAAANGLKRGDLQILNLTATDPAVRQQIVDFMSGVNFAQEGTWEEVGTHIYMVAPSYAYVEVVPPSPRSPIRN